MLQTTNYNLKKIELTDSPPDITVINPNWDSIDAEMKSLRELNNSLAAYSVASGTNTYTATIAGITALTEGFSIKIKFTNANTGASTLNINGLGAKTITKGNGSSLAIGNIKAGQICNLVYGGTNFQLLGEGGEYGTAIAGDVLSGKTIGTENGLINGAIPSKASATITPSTANQIISAGQYLSGDQTILGDSDLISANIKSGANIFGVAGNVNVVDTSAGDAVAAEILTTKKAYVDGTLVTGIMANKGAVTLIPGASAVAIPAGYHNGSGIVSGVTNLSSDNIKSGVNVGGVVGTSFPLPTYSASNLVSAISTSGAINGTLAQSGILTTYTTSACLISFEITSSSTINVSSSKEFYYLKGSGAIASTNANITGFGRIIIFNPSKSVLTLTGNSNNTMQAVYNYIS